MIFSKRTIFLLLLINWIRSKKYQLKRNGIHIEKCHFFLSSFLEAEANRNRHTMRVNIRFILF